MVIEHCLHQGVEMATFRRLAQCIEIVRLKFPFHPITTVNVKNHISQNNFCIRL